MLKNKFEIVYMKLFLPIFLPFLFFLKFSLINLNMGFKVCTSMLESMQVTNPLEAK